MRLKKKKKILFQPHHIHRDIHETEKNQRASQKGEDLFVEKISLSVNFLQGNKIKQKKEQIIIKQSNKTHKKEIIIPTEIKVRIKTDAKEGWSGCSSEADAAVH